MSKLPNKDLPTMTIKYGKPSPNDSTNDPEAAAKLKSKNLLKQQQRLQQQQQQQHQEPPKSVDDQLRASIEKTCHKLPPQILDRAMTELFELLDQEERLALIHYPDQISEQVQKFLTELYPLNTVPGGKNPPATPTSTALSDKSLSGSQFKSPQIGTSPSPASNSAAGNTGDNPTDMDTSENTESEASYTFTLEGIDSSNMSHWVKGFTFSSLASDEAQELSLLLTDDATKEHPVRFTTKSEKAIQWIAAVAKDLGLRHTVVKTVWVKFQIFLEEQFRAKSVISLNELQYLFIKRNKLTSDFKILDEKPRVSMKNRIPGFDILFETNEEGYKELEKLGFALRSPMTLRPLSISFRSKRFIEMKKASEKASEEAKLNRKRKHEANVPDVGGPEFLEATHKVIDEIADRQSMQLTFISQITTFTVDIKKAVAKFFANKDLAISIKKQLTPAITNRMNLSIRHRHRCRRRRSQVLERVRTKA